MNMRCLNTGQSINEFVDQLMEKIISRLIQIFQHTTVKLQRSDITAGKNHIPTNRKLKYHMLKLSCKCAVWCCSNRNRFCNSDNSLKRRNEVKFCLCASELLSPTTNTTGTSCKSLRASGRTSPGSWKTSSTGRFVWLCGDALKIQRVKISTI